MSVLSAAQVYALARGAGLSDGAAKIATAVAGAESRYNTAAIGDVSLEDSTWGPSVGLWQIRSVKAQTGTGGDRDASRLTDPTFNAKAMASISNGGAHWTAWSTYNSGAYKAYLPQARDAVGSNADAWATMLPAADLAVSSKNPLSSVGNGALGFLGKVTSPFTGWVKELGQEIETSLLTATLYLGFLGTAVGLVVIGGYKMAKKAGS